MENNVHIIERVLVEINTQEINSTNAIKNNISLFLSEEIFPEIEQVFKQFGYQNTILRLDKITIDLSLSVKDNKLVLKDNISFPLVDQFKSQVYERIFELSKGSNLKDEPVKEVTANENLEQIFLFFLERGYYPWYGNQSHIREFIENMAWNKSFNNKIFTTKLKNLLKQKRVFQRFVYQFPLSMVFSFILTKSRFTEIETHISESNSLSLSPIKTSFLNTLFNLYTETNLIAMMKCLEDWVQQLYSDGTYLGSELNKEILKSIPGSVMNSLHIQDVLNRMLEFKPSGNSINPDQELISEYENEDGSQLNDSLIKEHKKDDDFFENNLNEIRVQNAGLIILHPFLKQLFSSLGFLNKQNQILTIKQNHAVQLLHFISTGKEEFWEGDMVFEKFVCGVPLNSPIPKESLLTEKMKQEAENLLIEVVKNWPALKNTSTDGLRQLFFQREGKLIKRERNYKLIVERRSQDVLLEKLDWNLSLIKIPWTNELLYVEW